MDFKLAMQILDEKRWEDLKQLQLPAYFRLNESCARIENETQLISKISGLLQENLPTETEIIFLKTLINSCCRICDSNSLKNESSGLIENQLPYESAIKIATEKIIKVSEPNSEPQDEVLLKLYLKFTCNFVTFLCKTVKNPTFEPVPDCLQNPLLKKAIMNLTQSSSEEVATISCIFCYNALTELSEKSYFNFENQLDLLSLFIKTHEKIGCNAAEEGIFHLISIPTIFTNFYDCSSANEKKILMQIIRKHFDEEMKCNLPDDNVNFLIQRFNTITDKVTLTNNIKNLQPDEPEELSILLDLILHMCSCEMKFLHFVQKNKSFLINCVGLLKMLHLTGKSQDSFFSPVDYTKEMMMASNSNKKDNSAFEDFGEFNAMVYGFKSKLVRIIGNLSHLNKENQDLIREMEGLSIIMDCCILDAKNPLIKECSIFAIRNLCENNLENQEQIHKTVKMETDSTQLLEKMGLTLQDNEDGKGIRIAPIKRKNN